VGLFKDGWDEMLSALNGKNCQEFFCDHGFNREKVLGTLKGTEYRFLPLPRGPKAGAQTNPPDSVFINTEGLYITADSGAVTLGNERYNLVNNSNVRALILLHELGHQLGIFPADVGSADLDARNAAHSIEILKHCFPLYSFPVR